MEYLVARERAHRIRVDLISRGFRVFPYEERLSPRARSLLSKCDLLVDETTRPVLNGGGGITYGNERWVVEWAEIAWLIAGGSYRQLRELLADALNDVSVQRALRAEFELRCPNIPLRPTEEVLKEYMRAWNEGRVP